MKKLFLLFFILITFNSVFSINETEKNKIFKRLEIFSYFITNIEHSKIKYNNNTIKSNFITIRFYYDDNLSRITFVINENNLKLESIFVDVENLLKEKFNKNLIKKKILDFFKDNRKDINFDLFKLVFSTKKDSCEKYSLLYNGYLSMDNLDIREISFNGKSENIAIKYSLDGTFKQPINKIIINREEAEKIVKDFFEKEKKKKFFKILKLKQDDKLDIYKGEIKETDKLKEFIGYDLSKPIIIRPNYLLKNNFIKNFISDKKINSGIDENRYAWIINTYIIRDIGHKKYKGVRNIIFYVDTETGEIIGGKYEGDNIFDGFGEPIIDGYMLK